MIKYYFPDEISSLNSDWLITSIEQLNEGDTIVFTNCYGGEVSVAMKIADIIRAKKLNTEAHYIVASAGILCFAAGINRYAYDTARFLLHEVIVPAYVEVNVRESDLQSDAETLKQYNDVLIKQLANLLEQEPSNIEKLVRANGGLGTWINTEEAIMLNLITDIVEPTQVVNYVFNLLKEGERKMVEQAVNETLQTLQETAEQQSIEETPVSIDASRMIEELRAEIEELKKMHAELLELKRAQDELHEKQKMLEAELRKPRAKIPPIPTEFVERKLNDNKKPTLVDWIREKTVNLKI